MADSLGELETLIILAVLRLGDDAYGVSIRDEIEERTGRRLTRGAIYTALRRLRAKGLLESEMSDPTPVRGGRAKRFFRPTPAGLAAVRRTTDQLDRMREGLDPLPSDG
ncbi:MAG: PadR family transcriptional regulator [Gemmatimonadetes bacterium]|nr:PadR family transcriptional regulator [Gemmatimonadota bacterium]NIR81291.1 PadR family transcriptional regulator [Gemmatimonadota bacterium]NIT90126.1 PadR family transcriptional regulator [Gemmatimonadota bacterium]NIU33953.1 PadR family transcriptional regulator [Gemmatimonadota bacterium]NIU38132.1 PadR family transcriptional regulator [Gemmatimonadota bacterium]